MILTQIIFLMIFSSDFFSVLFFQVLDFMILEKKLKKKPVKISKKTLEIFQFFKRSQNTIRSFFSF
jgi:Zn-dependent protease with chaperone function